MRGGVPGGPSGTRGRLAELRKSAKRAADYQRTLKPPKFVLSCPTKMNTFDKIFEENVKVLREDIQKLIRENFIYLPLCKHDRISKTKYFESEDNCFELNDELIDNQNKFVLEMLNGV